MPDTYDKVAECVRDYWKKSYPQDVVVFFQQKYSYEKSWELHEELVECIGICNFRDMEFLNDFCEGQTDFKLEKIVPLSYVLECYRWSDLDIQGGKH